MLTLSRVFQWDHRGATNGEDVDTLTLVIVGESKRQLGLVVDRVLGEEDVVIKSIADNYRNLAGIAGATILGDGRVSLILDPLALIEMSSHPVVATTDT
jgi:two-component system chemotaxis sensor kinase CheA